jgi:hypothetical protein
MEQTIEQKNKALVLEAFDTLFNRRDFAAPKSSGRPTTFNTALIFHRDATASLIWSGAPQPR